MNAGELSQRGVGALRVVVACASTSIRVPVLRAQADTLHWQWHSALTRSLSAHRLRSGI